MRILHAIGGDVVQDLNKRYQQVPPFGRGTIHRFTGNPSAMWKLAARDFEHLLQVTTRFQCHMSTAWLITYLQCALPVFEGLLHTQQDNTLLRTLLFDLAMWHAFAKLRLHMDTMLNDFRALTSTLGRSVRIFINEVCSQYDTTELPHELAARGRRAAAIAKKSDSAGPSQKKKNGDYTPPTQTQRTRPHTKHITRPRGIPR